MSTILCVDDTPDHLKLLREELTDEGYDVLNATSGEDALRILDERAVSAVVLDWLMPDMDGLETLRHIRQRFDGVELPVIMVTAVADPESTVEALEAGANDYVTKPIEIEVVLARLRAHIRVFELTRERDLLARRKDEFLAVFNHDLRGPITAISGYASLLNGVLQNEDGLERLRNMASAISRNADSMLRMVQQYLDVDELESRVGQAVAAQQVDAVELVSTLLRDFAKRASDKQMTLTPDVAPTTILGDGGQLRQVLDNLVSNAIKFSDTGTNVRVSVAPEGYEAVVRVRDEGPGLKPEDMSRLFTKFGRLAARPTGGEDSLGVGLFAARLLVEGMAGTIGAQNNEDGPGATFWFRVPLI